MRVRLMKFAFLGLAVIGAGLAATAPVEAGPATPPIGNLDVVFANNVDYFGPAVITVEGWTLLQEDPFRFASLGVRLVVDGVIYANGPYCHPDPLVGCYHVANVWRPDVGIAFAQGDHHGYEFSEEAPTFGTHTFCVQALNQVQWHTIVCKVRDVGPIAATPVSPAGHFLNPERTAGLIVYYNPATYTYEQVCTGTVVWSPSGDVGQTAAHCFFAHGAYDPPGPNSGVPFFFVPGGHYNAAGDFVSPFGIFQITSLHPDVAWLSNQTTSSLTFCTSQY